MSNSISVKVFEKNHRVEFHVTVTHEGFDPEPAVFEDLSDAMELLADWEGSDPEGFADYVSLKVVKVYEFNKESLKKAARMFQEEQYEKG